MTTFFNRRRGGRVLASLAVATALLGTACGSDSDTSSSGSTDSDTPAADSGLTPVRLQLQWFPQSQFAGYYAALGEGYYEEEGLDVEILAGSVEIVPQTVVDSSQAEFAVSWVPKTLASIEQGADLVEIGQIFQRSGTTQVAWADSGIATAKDLADTKVGNWGYGNEFELLAGLKKAGIDPDTGVEMVQQNFDMTALINKEIDSAQAMTYNEFGLLLQTTDPETGELFQKEQFSVVNWNDEGTAMLNDALWAGGEWLEDEANAEITVKFLKASIKGWAFCRDNVEKCVQHVVDAGTELDELHMTYMLNEVNDLVWPSPDGAGQIDEDSWKTTIDISLDSELITADPGTDVYDLSFLETALAELEAEGVDVKGLGFTKVETDLSGAK